MSKDIKRVRVEEIDWTAMLPSLCLFRSFRMAIHPAKLLTSLFLVVLLYLSGCILDAAWGPAVYSDEISQYASSSPEEFNNWLNSRETDVRFRLLRMVGNLDTLKASPSDLADNPKRFRLAIQAIHEHYVQKRKTIIEDNKDTTDEAHRKRVENRLREIRAESEVDIRELRAIQPNGVFDATLRFEVDAFERMVRGAIALNLDVMPVIRGEAYNRDSIAGALREMFVTVPAWLLSTHRWFLLTWSVLAWVIWSFLGGAVARMCALDATQNKRINLVAAARYAFRHWGSYAATPFVPVLVGLGMVLVLWLFGLVFYGIPGLRYVSGVFGSLIFALPILLGLGVTLLIIGLVFGGNLLFPSIAVEGSDGFDATSRAYNFVVGRPWHLFIYTLVSLIYGAITYLFLGTLVFITLYLVQGVVAMGAGVMIEGARGGSPFDDILPRPELGRLTYNIDSFSVEGVLTMVWVYLFVGLLAAYAVSFYFTAQTWTYLLLRRWVDGTDMGEVHHAPELEATDGDTDGGGSAPASTAPPAPVVPDEVEPPSTDAPG
ncbi:MAG: hypothetical protein K8S99_09855 [Planctomycetes bacterium]|nr:hypothetical protein [Planctomycetota bacterium]